mmetsp:Transcript_131355/g.319168  ORF Transcript_131355/g.319168 Transcript_131355/m.319168 type:complete len:223 (-) Transcript_131355:84-752(-)
MASFVVLLRALEVEETALGVVPLEADEALLVRCFSFSFCSTTIFSCWAASACFWMRSFAASKSTFAALSRALPAASLFASSPSNLAICLRPFWSCVSSLPLAFSSTSWSCLWGSCSTALSSKKYFSRKLGSLKPKLAPPAPLASCPAWPLRWAVASCALRSTTSSKSAGNATSGSSASASAPGSKGGGSKVRACSSSRYWPSSWRLESPRRLALARLLSISS